MPGLPGVLAEMSCEHVWGNQSCKHCNAPRPPAGICSLCGRPGDDHKWKYGGTWLEKPICPGKVPA